MKITLELIRDTLKNTLGRDSFVAAFVNRVEEDMACPTACISAKGVLRYNPAFADTFIACKADVFCLVLHEIMHPLFGHFVYKGGRLENLAADMVINASISLLFPEPSNRGHLFKKVYEPKGLEGLLRPMSLMYQSRYFNLYNVFYGNVGVDERLTTGEVIQALKVLTPSSETENVLLLGSHGGAADASSVSGLPADTLSRFAEEIRHASKRRSIYTAGVGENLCDLFLEALKTHLSIRKTLLRKFATKRKMDRFKESFQRPAIGVSPIPLHPSKRDFVLLAAGIPPFHYHNQAQRMAVKEHGLAVYLDVSGSVNESLPEIVGILSSLRAELTSIFLFSNQAVEVPFKILLDGRVRTTYGTDFDCIADSVIERGFDKAVIVTDGYASLKTEKQAELRKRKFLAMTILFGGKTDCEEFAPFGDVLQLADITA